MILTHHPDIPDRDTGLKFLGYWHRPELPKRWGGHTRPSKLKLVLPNPADYVNSSWSGFEREVIVAYLKNGMPWERWFGQSWCRFGCVDEDDLTHFMGSQDFTDGVYVWPQGFAHYVEKHAVKPPQEFIDHVMRR